MQDFKNKTKELVRNRMNNKKIVLFGAGVVAVEFYNKHKNLLNITRVVSNFSKECGPMAFLNELDIVQFDKNQIADDEYMIVCGPIAFRTIELQLENCGFTMYEDYIESSIAEAIFSGKKIALFYGQCILRDVHKCIVGVNAFNEKYASIFTQTTTGQTKIANRLLYYAKDLCDAYVYTPKILDLDSIYSLQPHELPKDCQIVSVSNLLCSVYWPEIIPKLDRYNPYYLYSYNVNRHGEDILGHTIYRREDSNINKLVKKGMPTKEIVKKLSDEDFYSEKTVRKNFELGMKLIRVAENNVDITIADYIEENYAKLPLYQNFIHPSKYVIYEYVKKIVEELGADTSEIPALLEASPKHIHQGGDVPIYPSIVRNLNLEFVDVDSEYEVMIGNGIAKMNFEEYIEHFAEYTRMSMNIINIIREPICQ